MSLVVALLAVFGLAFALKEAEGPWGMMSRLRQKLFACPALGVFWFKLLDCYFCTGFWCGMVVYLLVGDPIKWNWVPIWGLAGGAVSLILDGLLTRLHRQ